MLRCLPGHTGIGPQRKIGPMAAGTFRPQFRPQLRRIESRQNGRVKELRAALARTGRTPDGLVAIEGEHLVQEALRSRLRFATVFLREGYSPAYELPDVEHLLLPADVFASAVSTEQPQGIAALVHAPTFSADALFPAATPPLLPPLVPPLILVLAGLQDPGNVGTLIRSAEAFGASGVLLLPGTASPWNPKALRASAGSAFRVPMLTIAEADALTLLRDRGVPALAAVVHGGVPVAEARLAEPAALLIGNEGAGLSPALLAAAHRRVTIPTPGPVDSLNAAIAGSLLLYAAATQRAEAAMQRAATHRDHDGAQP
jgi:TrmH family RNA methyltransferase